MNIIVINDTEYNVSFDEKELKEFRREVIQNASFVVHKSYEDNHGPYYGTGITDSLSIQNYREYYIENDEDGEQLFHFEYDEYNFPYLVSLIDRLLNYDMSALYEIYFPDFTKEMVCLENIIYEKLSEVQRDIKSKGNIAISEDIVESLKKLQHSEYVFPAAKYYVQLLDLIHLERVTTLIL